MLGRLRGETENAAATLPIKKICGPSGLEFVLIQPKNSSAVAKSSPRGSNLPTLLDHLWDKTMTVEELVVGFHARTDKDAELQSTPIVPGHMMLRETGLDSNEQSMTVEKVSGSYHVHRISSALRSAYKKKLPYSAVLNMHPGSQAK